MSENDDEKYEGQGPNEVTRGAKRIAMQREIFCLEYCADLNLERAVIAAGYKKDQALSKGHRLLDIPEIQERIAYLNKEKLDRLHITKDRIANELAKIAFGNSAAVVSWAGKTITLKNSNELSPEVLAMVSEVSNTRDGIKIKFHSKEKCLELLGRMEGMWDDKLKLGDMGGGSLIPQKMIVEVVTAAPPAPALPPAPKPETKEKENADQPAADV